MAECLGSERGGAKFNASGLAVTSASDWQIASSLHHLKLNNTAFNQTNKHPHYFSQSDLVTIQQTTYTSSNSSTLPPFLSFFLQPFEKNNSIPLYPLDFPPAGENSLSHCDRNFDSITPALVPKLLLLDAHRTHPQRFTIPEALTSELCCNFSRVHHDCLRNSEQRHKKHTCLLHSVAPHSQTAMASALADQAARMNLK